MTMADEGDSSFGDTAMMLSEEEDAFFSPAAYGHGQDGQLPGQDDDGDKSSSSDDSDTDNVAAEDDDGDLLGTLAAAAVAQAPPQHVANAALQSGDADLLADPAPQPPSYSDDFLASKLVHFHMDLEHAGERVGIIQLTMVATDPYSKTELGRWNKYFKTHADKHKYWNYAGAAESHGLVPSSLQFQGAKTLQEEWPSLIEFMEGLLDNGAKCGCLVAWGGAGCDIEWFFKTTELCPQHLRTTFRQPRWTPYFWDPLKTIKNYKSCPLNIAQSNILGYGLGTVYCFVTGQTQLIGAHDSLVDVCAQITVVHYLSDNPPARLGPAGSWLNATRGPLLLTDIYKTKRESHHKQAVETSHPVPPGWTDHNLPASAQSAPWKYDGGEGRGQTQCSSSAAECRTLLDLFLFFSPPFGLVGARCSNNKCVRN